MNRNLLYNKEELNRILAEDECVIFGGGGAGKAVLAYAISQYKTIDRILVSDISKNPCTVWGATVVDVKYYKDKLEKTSLIVCVREELHDEIADLIAGIEVKQVVFISDKLYTELRSKMENPIFIQRPIMQLLILNILDHCNLRCKGCDHFANVADEYSVPLNVLQRDIERMRELLGKDGIREISVMGGETLLHPELPEIIEMVRMNFPNVMIRVTTNGLLLLNQNDRFWSVCRENSATIVLTRYPINLKFEKIKEKAKLEKVSFVYFEGTDDEVEKNFSKHIIDLNGRSKPEEVFGKCGIANYGNFLMEGKLYGCPFAAQSYRIFNKKFDTDLQMCEEDYLDIYNIRNKQEVLEFAAKPKPYCKYCGGLKDGITWGISKKEISEWVEM